VINMRPTERHPSRSVTAVRLPELFEELSKSAVAVQLDENSPQECIDDMEGVTHTHVIEKESSTLLYKTHYVPEIDTYFLLEKIELVYIHTDEDGVYMNTDEEGNFIPTANVLLARGKKK